MNPEEINKLIPIEGVDTRELYGAQDVYVEQIRSLAPKVKIVARGSSLRVLGAKADVEAFERKMNSLIDYYIKYRHISKEVVAQAFSAGLSDRVEAVSDKDTIVFGNNGIAVRARTVNQRRLVELYEANDLLFAVGPAGSGKTYTVGGACVEGADGAACDTDASGRRSGGEAGIPARRHEGEARSLPPASVRCAERYDPRGQVAEVYRRGDGSDCAAGIYARPDA